MKKHSNNILRNACRLCCGLAAALTMTACADFFEQESEHVIFADDSHLSNATDTIYSVTGVLSKLQALADRTILLGELRGDLTDITADAASDLRDIANFNIGDDNKYNVPRDYYAVINNCNYFIANADTAMKNNRNEYIFMKEYAAIKAIRAWTYLQMVLNYGAVPFVTTPILTKQESEAEYPSYDLQAVCQYFISDLQPLAERYGNEYPGYGTIRNTDSRFFWFPINIVLGDLNLWLGSATANNAAYREAALRYYKYISERNGQNSTYSTSLSLMTWTPGNSTWMALTGWGNLNFFNDENYSSDSELITMIAGDSIRAEGNYSELRNIFTSREENNYRVSVTPSQGLINLSESQMHCCVSKSGQSVYYAPEGLSLHRTGDLRLFNVYRTGYTNDPITGNRIETQTIDKYSSVRNVHIYRRQMVYLRMAEALNLAGYPRMAYQILSQGINNTVLSEEVYPYYSESDSVYISQFDFPASRYGIFEVENLVNNRTTGVINTLGIHTRGSGWTPMNEFYQLPIDTLQTEAAQTPRLQAFVDSLILNEGALEMAFEGTRYYDLMRYAMRQSNPGQTLASYVYARRGKQNSDAMRSEIAKDLTDQRNWYLQWNGKIGN